MEEYTLTPMYLSVYRTQSMDWSVNVICVEMFIAVTALQTDRLLGLGALGLHFNGNAPAKPGCRNFPRRLPSLGTPPDPSLTAFDCWHERQRCKKTCASLGKKQNKTKHDHVAHV